MMDNIGYLKQAVDRAFFDKNIDANPLSPEFIVNRPDKKQLFLPTLQEEFANCLDFTLSVAFITQSGLDTIKTQLMDLNLKGIKGRILTSTYLGFNHPDVFASLLKIPNVEVRISDKEGFHSKGYLFEHKDYQSFIIGSSNLTTKALKVNYEWNVKLTSLDHGELISEIRSHVEEEWENAQPLSEKWISQFKIEYQSLVEPRTLNIAKIIAEDSGYITPNLMQKEALKELAELRNRGEQNESDTINTARGLLVGKSFSMVPALYDGEDASKAMEENKAPQNLIHDGAAEFHFTSASTVRVELLGTYRPDYDTSYTLTNNRLIIDHRNIPYSIKNGAISFDSWTTDAGGHTITWSFGPTEGLVGNSSENTSDTSVDTKNLTSEQFKNWVSAVLDKQFSLGRTSFPYDLSIENHDGYAYVRVKHSELQVDTITMFRINGKGQLEEEDVSNGYPATYKVVSSKFMDTSEVTFEK